jgi:hypothetical protein
MRVAMRKAIFDGAAGLVPSRILNRPAAQILRARLATADKRRRTNVGPGMPIVGEIVLGGAPDWRARFTAALWSLARKASDDKDRGIWMICVAASPDAPDDLYAVTIQAAAPTQLHLMADAAQAAAFRARYVHQASLREAEGHRLPGALEVLARIEPDRSAFSRATAVRAAAHTFVKRMGGEGSVIAVHGTRSAEACAAYLHSNDRARSMRLLVLGDPREAPPTLSADARAMVARRAGFSLLDELALVRYCDGYVGQADHYAIVAADGGVPCLLSTEASVSCASSSPVRFVPDLASPLGPWLESRVPGAPSTAARNGMQA